MLFPRPSRGEGQVRRHADCGCWPITGLFQWILNRFEPWMNRPPGSLRSVTLVWRTCYRMRFAPCTFRFKLCDGPLHTSAYPLLLEVFFLLAESVHGPWNQALEPLQVLRIAFSFQPEEYMINRLVGSTAKERIGASPQFLKPGMIAGLQLLTQLLYQCHAAHPAQALPGALPDVGKIMV